MRDAGSEALDTEQSTPDSLVTPDADDHVEQVHLIDLDAMPRMREAVLHHSRSLASGRHGSEVRESAWPAEMVQEIGRRFAEANGVAEYAARREPVNLNLPHAFDGRSYRVTAESGLHPNVGSPSRRLLDVLGNSQSGAPTIDDLDRLELARLLATAVAALHAGDITTGGLDSSTVSIATAPRPSLALLTPGSLRPVGAEQLDGDVVIRRVDDDRRDLACLIGQLVDLDAPEDKTVAGLTSEQSAVLRSLKSRADRTPGARPTAAQWKSALTA